MKEYILNFRLGTCEWKVFERFMDVIRELVSDCTVDEISYVLGVGSRDKDEEDK